MDIKISFSLGACRKNAGFTLREAAKELGISYQTLSKYENNSSNIPMNLLKNIVSLYQVPSDYIFLGKKYDLIRRIKKEKIKE